MALSSPQMRSRSAVRRNRRKRELAPIFVPQFSEWRAAMLAQDPDVAARIVKAKRVIWAWCYVAGFGSGLLVARLVRSVPIAADSLAQTKRVAPAGKADRALQGGAAPTARVPVVTIREVKR